MLLYLSLALLAASSMAQDEGDDKKDPSAIYRDIFCTMLREHGQSHFVAKDVSDFFGIVHGDAALKVAMGGDPFIGCDWSCEAFLVFLSRGHIVCTVPWIESSSK